MINITILYTHSLEWLHNRRWWPLPMPPERIASRPVAPTDVQCFYLAFHKAYVCFVQRYPQWVQRGFDAGFLHQALASWQPRYRKTAKSIAALPTGAALAAAWDQQFGILAPDVTRITEKAELTRAAGYFLYRFQIEWEQLDVP